MGLALILVERFGRKILLFSSATICSISIASLGVYFYLEENMCLEDDESCSSGINSTVVIVILHHFIVNFILDISMFKIKHTTIK